MPFEYDNDYTEADWQYEAMAQELAELDADRRDMQETPCPEDVVVMEDPAAKLYLAIGGVFLDSEGPIGMVIEKPLKPKKEAA